MRVYFGINLIAMWFHFWPIQALISEARQTGVQKADSDDSKHRLRCVMASIYVGKCLRNSSAAVPASAAANQPATKQQTVYRPAEAAAAAAALLVLAIKTLSLYADYFIRLQGLMSYLGYVFNIYFLVYFLLFVGLMMLLVEHFGSCCSFLTYNL